MIIDCHSHIGHDWKNPPTYIADYLHLLKSIGADAGIVMPEPGHINETTCERILLWEFDKDQIHYYSPHYNSDDVSILKNTSQIINDEIYACISDAILEGIKVFYAPMIHPIIDDLHFYDEIKNRYNSVALKVHGIAGGYSPEMIDSDHVEAIKKTGLPLIIHTDFDRDISTKRGKIRNMNTARKWFDFLKNNGLKGYLCHGCRMDISVLKDVSETDDVIVGVGPDWAIQNDLNRLFPSDNMNYLENLIKHLPKEKLAFDIDYNYLQGDVGFVKRLTDCLPTEYTEFVMYKNAINFFDLPI